MRQPSMRVSSVRADRGEDGGKETKPFFFGMRGRKQRCLLGLRKMPPCSLRLSFRRRLRTWPAFFIFQRPARKRKGKRIQRCNFAFHAVDWKISTEPRNFTFRVHLHLWCRGMYDAFPAKSFNSKKRCRYIAKRQVALPAANDLLVLAPPPYPILIFVAPTPGLDCCNDTKMSMGQDTKK